MPSLEHDLLRLRCSDEERIVRQKHRVGFKEGQTAQYMANVIEDIPRDATIDEIELHLVGDTSILTIEFHEERRE